MNSRPRMPEKPTDKAPKQQILDLLADRGIDNDELVRRIEKLYKRAGSPCGPGVKGVAEWLIGCDSG